MAAATALEAPRAAWIALLLASLLLASRGPLPRFLAGASLGALIASLGPPPHAIERLALHRPVEALAVVQGTPWVDDRGQRRCWIRLAEVRQGERSLRLEQEAYLRVPVEGSEMVRRGATLRLRGYVSRSPPARNRRAARPGPWRFSVPSARFLELEASPRPWLRGLGRLRGVLLDALEGWSDPDSAALVATLWLGERSQLPERWQRALRAWGLAHLTAVSGLHVGAVAVMLWAAGALLGALVLSVAPRRGRFHFFARWPRLLLVLLGVVFYAGLVGPRPSVLRASLMAVIAVSALMLERPPAALNALAVAVALMAFSHPPVIADLGFQLSAAATFGLLIGTLPIARRLSGREKPSPFALSLASSLAAQLAVLPIAAPTFALLHPASALVHLLAVPWLLLSLFVGACGLGISLALPSVDGSTAMGPLVLLLDVLADLPPGPFATWPISITAPAALLLVAALVPAIWLPRSALRKLTLPFLLLAGVASVQLFSPPTVAEAGRLATEASVTAIDVGQGDALLLRSPGVSILVDGGGWRRGDSASRLLLPPLADLGVRRLDAVVLTHPDADHCDGLRDLASYLPIDEVWSAAGWAEPCAGELLGRRGPVLHALWRGRALRRGAWRFEVLWPTAGRRRGDGNERSLVLRAEALGRSVLLTGDIDVAVERQLLAGHDVPGVVLRADVLKVAHHGSKSSTAAAFLDAVSPTHALIQAGRKNAYGHPHASVRARLRERHIQTWRTDRHGQVELRWRRGGPIRCRVMAGSS